MCIVGRVPSGHREPSNEKLLFYSHNSFNLGEKAKARIIMYLHNISIHFMGQLDLTIVRKDNRQGGQSSGMTNVRGTFVMEDICPR